MDFPAVAKAAADAATASDAEFSSRLFVIFMAPSGGLFIHRVGYGSHQLGGGDAEEDFATSCKNAVEKLWPELPIKKRRQLQIAAHMLAHSPIGKMVAGTVAPDDD